MTNSARRLGAGALLAVLVVAAQALPARSAVPTFTIYGRGWGHGLGLSQWGAKGLADKGWSTGRILAHFYRGTAIATTTAVPTVRVGLAWEQTAMDVTASGRFYLYDSSGKLRASGSSGQTWRLKPTGVGSNIVVLGPSGATAFTSASPVTLRYEANGTQVKLAQTGYTYKHGRIDFDVNTTTGKQRAILIVPIEQYLYGLGEMPSSWAADALKAQAIAARTYATEKILRLGQNRPTCNCGVYASTLDQAYVGVAQEVAAWVNAVDATKSQVATYNRKPIQAYYHATDGGFTENNENVWGGSAIPYLRGTCDPGDYASGANPRGNWRFAAGGDVIGARLAQGGYVVGTVQSIHIVPPRGASGRVLRVIDTTHGGISVKGTTGSARIAGGTFSSLVGLYSTLISYNIAGPIRARYDALMCKPGFPINREHAWDDLNGTVRASAQDFTNGRVWRISSNSKVYWLYGPILARYNTERSKKVDLGLPTSEVFTISGGKRANFERGFITWNTSSGATAVTRYR